jgi:hypothetical protein
VSWFGTSVGRYGVRSVFSEDSGTAKESLHVAKQAADHRLSLSLRPTAAVAIPALVLMVFVVTLIGWQPSGIIAASLGAGTSVLSALLVNLIDRKGSGARIRASLSRLSVRSLTSLAVLLAGRDGPALLEESNGHLAGWDGHDELRGWAKLKQAAAFVKAGAEYRYLNITEAAWKPVDAALRSRFWTGLFVAGPTIVDTFEVLTHKGAMTVLTSWGSIFCVGAGLAGAVKGLRKYRDVHPPEPKARRTRSE